MEKRNVNVKISTMNHDKLIQLTKHEKLINMTMSKAAIIDIALSHLFKDLQTNNLEFYAIEHLQYLTKYKNELKT